jgi:ring-1,2-phenylacetyl-CoA epoxidase subunit PaaC
MAAPSSLDPRPEAPAHPPGTPSPLASTSIAIDATPKLRYLLRIADTCLIHAQRLAEWCGHGPVLEEDIALTNMALDLLGQARALLAHAGALDGNGFDEDQLAFLRDERDFFNLTLVEQPLRKASAHSPGGDFADTVLRNLLVAAWLRLLWERLVASRDAELAAIAGKAVKEALYHQRHATGWVVRLGDGSEESAARMRAALDRAWPYTREMFVRDAVDDAAEAAGLGPARDGLREIWQREVAAVLLEAGLAPPADTPFVSTGTQGRHSEHMGFILAEMQVLQRTHPGARW